MMSLQPLSPVQNEKELLTRCSQIAGMSLGQLAAKFGFGLDKEPNARKGLAGQLIERVLGTTAGNAALPDFHHLGVELKTIPLNASGRPSESTFVTTISLLSIHQEEWEKSACYQKLKRVLWLPVEGDVAIPFAHRRIGNALLWSPSAEDLCILKSDWLELSSMIGMGRLEQINASFGTYLQVRPKAANAKTLCYGFDEQGQKILTLPRGFYLRSQFTASLF